MRAYEHVVVVTSPHPYAEFPLDMLRYDGLAPQQSKDVTTIERGRTNERVTLTRWASREWKPERQRWVSFGWEVLSHDKRAL